MLCRTWCTWKFSARMILETPRKLKFLGGFTKIYPRNLYTAEISGWLLASFEPPIYPHVWKEIHAGLVLVTRTHRTKKGSDLAFWIGGVGCTTKHSCKDIVLYKTSYWTKMIYHHNIIYISYILIHLEKNICTIYLLHHKDCGWNLKKKAPRTFFPTLEDITSKTSSSSRWVKSCGLCLAKDWSREDTRLAKFPAAKNIQIFFWTERKSWKKKFCQKFPFRII